MPINHFSVSLSKSECDCKFNYNLLRRIRQGNSPSTTNWAITLANEQLFKGLLCSNCLLYIYKSIEIVNLDQLNAQVSLCNLSQAPRLPVYDTFCCPIRATVPERDMTKIKLLEDPLLSQYNSHAI